MKYFIIFPLFAIYYLAQADLNQVVSKPEEVSSFIPFYFVDVEANCIDTTFKNMAATKSIPPQYIRVIDKFVYEVKFSIEIKSDTSWSKIFYLNIFSKDEIQMSVPFNEEQNLLTANTLYFFWTTIESYKNEKIIISLSENPISKMQDIEIDNPFKTKILFLK